MMLNDAVEADDAMSWTLATQLLGDRSELLRKLRDESLQQDEGLSPADRAKLIRLASTTEHIFMLISQLAHEYRQASKADEAFLERAELFGLDAPEEEAARQPDALELAAAASR